MNITDSHEVSIDVFGNGKDIWSCKWDGSGKVLVFRGDFINNRILFNHLLTLDCDIGLTVETFCEWAADLLNVLIRKDYEPYEN